MWKSYTVCTASMLIIKEQRTSPGLREEKTDRGGQRASRPIIYCQPTVRQGETLPHKNFPYYSITILQYYKHIHTHGENLQRAIKSESEVLFM